MKCKWIFVYHLTSDACDYIWMCDDDPASIMINHDLHEQLLETTDVETAALAVESAPLANERNTAADPADLHDVVIFALPFVEVESLAAAFCLSLKCQSHHRPEPWLHKLPVLSNVCSCYSWRTEARELDREHIGLCLRTDHTSASHRGITEPAVDESGRPSQEYLFWAYSKPEAAEEQEFCSIWFVRFEWLPCTEKNGDTS